MEFDWQAAHARLERARQALEGRGELPPEEAQRVLRERAEAFAREPQAVSLPAVGLELLVFSIGGGQYAIETSHVSEVLRFVEPTPVPCTPPLVLGVLNHRGRILPVLDLRRLFELADTETAAWSHIVTVEAGGMSFGMVASAVAGSIRVESQELALPSVAPTGGGALLIRGVTAQMVAVLDLEALARDPRVVVNEEVG